MDFASAPLSGFFEKKVCQKTLAGCAPAFLKKSSAKNFSRLRREQWVWCCVYTGCAANSGAGAAFSAAEGESKRNLS
ncbi:hypothetical protein ANACOL_03874 [Anaerotruncus colihominis DSM 17241]|uniref:Uncharacterized protein n=1 Tax=Anaerotruncus colihominis DSM 17241 TaxID=445972 RepID=B0PGE1_9FIRM|nr:hypothetical protein ANACOL_03874 [Anaerotruncus colihominis DSM 17241]